MIGFSTILRREIARFMKVIVQTLVTPFISSFLYLLIFSLFGIDFQPCEG